MTRGRKGHGMPREGPGWGWFWSVYDVAVVELFVVLMFQLYGLLPKPWISCLSRSFYSCWMTMLMGSEGQEPRQGRKAAFAGGLQAGGWSHYPTGFCHRETGYVCSTSRKRGRWVETQGCGVG